MQVFVANGTRQNWEFQYRVVENPTVRRLSIPAGRQAKVPEDFNDTALPAIVDQLERVGAVQYNRISDAKAAFALVYRIGAKPIGSDAIDTAAEKDIAVRQDIAGTKTEEAGLASFATLAAPNPEKLAAANLEVVQLTTQGDDQERGGVNFDKFYAMTCLACGHIFGKHGYYGCNRSARPGYPKDTDTLPAWMLEDKP